MTSDTCIESIRRDNIWMQSAQGNEREENPYLIIANIPDDLGIRRYQGLVMYLKSERKGTDALYVTCDKDCIPMTEMESYRTTHLYTFPYTPEDMMSIVPEVVLDRKIICYDCKDSYAPLRISLASYGQRYELCNEFEDVKEMAQRQNWFLSDYELDTILKAYGASTSDFANDILGTLMKIKFAYEKMKEDEERFLKSFSF